LLPTVIVTSFTFNIYQIKNPKSSASFPETGTGMTQAMGVLTPSRDMQE